MQIHPVDGIRRIYPISFYNRLEKIPSVEKIDGDIKKFSKQIQDFDLFKYYTEKFIKNSYEKGIHLDTYF
ncbi:MAG: hypothetical protein ACK4UJ_02955 [Leptonema sp. (in: bacteria)]